MNTEQDLINYLKKFKTHHKKIITGIGDDCSIIKFDSKKKYVFTTDTSLLGPHFTKDYSPEEIGYKTLATNISDIASMGCAPLYAMYALTLPKMSGVWIKKFFKGTKKLLDMHKISVIGGDTTKGPLSVTIQLIGIQYNKILTRDGAQLDDDIYVTGIIGGARAALVSKKGSKAHKYFRDYLVKPQPRVQIGLELSNFATSCIDISDGLAKDLKNIAIASNKGFEIDIDLIPTNPKFNSYIRKDKREECILGGGEDYELCFTASKKNRSKINDIVNKHNINITKIGTITPSKYKYMKSGKTYIAKTNGYDHFQSK